MKDIPLFVRRFSRNAFNCNAKCDNKLYAFKVGFTSKQYTEVLDDELTLRDEEGVMYVRSSNLIDAPKEMRKYIHNLQLDIEDWNKFVDDSIKVNFLILFFVDGNYYRNDFDC